MFNLFFDFKKDFFFFLIAINIVNDIIGKKNLVNSRVSGMVTGQLINSLVHEYLQSHICVTKIIKQNDSGQDISPHCNRICQI